LKTADYNIVDGRNPGGPLDIHWINDVRLDASAIEQDWQSLAGRVAVSKESAEPFAGNFCNGSNNARR
jgi:hypothetical protein